MSCVTTIFFMVETFVFILWLWLKITTASPRRWLVPFEEHKTIKLKPVEIDTRIFYCVLARGKLSLCKHTPHTPDFHFSERHFCNVTLSISSISSNPSYAKPILPHRRKTLCLRFELGQTMS